MSDQDELTADPLPTATEAFNDAVTSYRSSAYLALSESIAMARMAESAFRRAEEIRSELIERISALEVK